MSFLKGLGTFTGEVTGKLIGGSVRVVGELAGSSFVKEIGDGLEKAMIQAGRTTGELASGTFDVAAGVVTGNKGKTNTGMNDIGGAVSDTARGIVGSAKYVYGSGKDIVEGLKEDDYAKVRTGAKVLF